MLFQAARDWTGQQASSPLNTLWTWRYIYWIAQHRDCTRPGQGSAIERCARVKRDGGLSHNGSGEFGGSSKRRRTTDLPEHVMFVGAVGQNDLAVGIRGGQRRDDLEDPDSSRTASTVEGEISGYSERGLGACRLINARRESLSAYIGGEDGSSWLCGGIVIGGGQITLGGHGNSITLVEHAGYRSRRKSSDRNCRPYPDIPGNDGGAEAANNRGSAQNSETAGRSHGYDGNTGGGGSREAPHIVTR